MEFELFVLDGPDEGKQVRLDRTIHIGSESLCDFELNDEYAEGFHTRIDIAGDRLFAKNLQDTNKTLVNGMKIIEERELNNGDVLGIGNTTIRVSFYQPSRSKPKPPAGVKAKPKRKTKANQTPITDRKKKIKKPMRASQAEFKEPLLEPEPAPEPEPAGKGGGMSVILLGFIALLAFIAYCVYWEKQQKPKNTGSNPPPAVTKSTETQ